MSNYSKYKERKPEDTVFAIQRILNETGLFPVLTWTERSYECARANRVELYPTNLGCNGKGTDELYATASGYAELIERLQNDMLVIRNKADSFKEELGFYEFPDEKVTPIQEILEDLDPFSSELLPRMGFQDPYSQMIFLRLFSKPYGCGNDTVVTVPFADPIDNRIRYLPHAFLTELNGSNGMAAGNTLEEAIVQGLSEVLERAANQRLIRGEAVPPEIPEDEIKQFSFYQLIEQVRAEGHYRISLLDCSMGKGWPVVGLCIADLETGHFGIRLGAHPSFAVAVERTLTEAFQGRNIELFTSINGVGSLEDARQYHNATNVVKIGAGIYPATLFSEKPDWEYRPWIRWEGLDNRGFLRGMLKLLKADGLHPMIRDCSFLGFPSCWVVVPGFSEIFQPGQTLYHVIASKVKNYRSWGHFPKLTDEEEKGLLRLIRFMEYSALENQVSLLSGRTLSSKYALDRVAAFLSLKQGDFSVSEHFFRKLIDSEPDKNERIYYSAMAQYARLRKKGYLPEQARTVIQKLFHEDAARRICADTEDLASIMQRHFPQMSCYDCANCEAARHDCNYPKVREILRKANSAMKTENVSQEALLQDLTVLLQD